MQTFETLLWDKKEGYVVITLNRPDRKNAFNLKMCEELFYALEMAEKDPKVRALIVTGGESVFCVGSDLKSRLEEQGEEVSTEGDKLIVSLHRIMSKIESIGKPFISMISGYALGAGLELALACDFRYASEKARFGLPEAKVGSMPGAGGTQRLSRLVNAGIAKEMMFTGAFINAEEALKIGLVNKVFPVGDLFAKTIEVATTITKMAPLSIRMIKAAVNMGLQMNLQSALSYETTCHSLLKDTLDRKEGIKAFTEKRDPVFQGR